MAVVSPKKEKALRERMKALDILEKDLEESFIRSGGRGGQKVNKSSSSVFLRHTPTGVEIKCQKGRSQTLNRYYARFLLCDRIEFIKKGPLSKIQIRIEKLKKQKQKRSKRAKEKYLS